MAGFAEIAIESVRRAGEHQRRSAGKEIVLNEDLGHTIKLAVDVESEEIIRECIRKAFPRHGFLGEEGGRSDVPGAEFVWVVDPLDGTGNYFRRAPHHCVSVACETRQGDPVCGVIHDWTRDEMFVVADGRFTVNGEPARVSDTDRFEKAVLLMSYSRMQPYLEQAAAQAGALMRRFCKVRQYGASALDLAWAAAGRAEASLSLGLHRWDMAAGVQMVRAAGGAVKLGESEGPMAPFDLVTTNGRIPVDFQLAMP